MLYMEESLPSNMASPSFTQINGISLPARSSSLGVTLNEPEFHARTPSINGYSAYGRNTASWKARKTIRKPTTLTMGRDMNLRRWDGAARRSTEWDGLRRVSCFSHGDLLWQS